MPKEFGNAQDLVTLEEIRQDAVILKDGSLHQLVMVGGLNFSLKSEAEQTMITQAYQNFLNSLDFPVQIVIHSRKINIDDYLGVLTEQIAKEPSELLQGQIAEYKEFVAGFVRENPIMAKVFLVVVSFSPIFFSAGKQAVASFLPFLKKKSKEEEKKSLQEKEAELQKNLEQLRQRVNQVVSGLQAIDLEATVLGDEELVELFYNFYNPGTIEKEKIAADDQTKKS